MYYRGFGVGIGMTLLCSDAEIHEWILFDSSTLRMSRVCQVALMDSALQR